MRKIHKFLSVLLAIMMVMSIIPITASATETTGTCGDNLTWSYDDTTCTLTISGEGDMYDYEADTDPTDGVNTDNRPWSSLTYNFKKIIIADGVTSIGNDAFYKCFNVISAIIPDSITSVGDRAFYYCDDQNVHHRHHHCRHVYHQSQVYHVCHHQSQVYRDYHRQHQYLYYFLQLQPRCNKV